jgi:3-methyladenine DNA glycosylase AlkD
MQTVQREIRSLANREVAIQSQRFFKTKRGEYGFGDFFLGVRMPVIRQLAKKYMLLEKEKTARLIQSKYHEERMLGLIILVNKYAATESEVEQKDLYQFYVSQFKYINNWDLVDVTCPHIVGKHLVDSSRKILYQWVKSPNLWERRISIISTSWFIRQNDFKDTLALATILLTDQQDLIHKATGWMLREVGKKDTTVLERFLKQYYREMPRTTLRYTIEKFPEARRQRYLKGEV